MRIAALINASAGTAKKLGEGFREQLEVQFRNAGLGASLEFVSGDALAAAAKAAVKLAEVNAIDAIVVGGGDGTVRCVASAVADTGIPLGIIPLGTLNHFAKDLHIPVKPEDAIAVIEAGHSRLVDAGEVNGELFINNSSIGIYPFLVLDRDRIQLKEGKQKWHAMLFAALRTLKKFPIRRLRVQTREESSYHRSPVVFVGNNAYGLGPGTLGKRERLDAGELAIYIAKRETRASLFMLGLRSLLGSVQQSEDFTMLKSTAAFVGGKISRLPVALDGEVEILATPLKYKTRPGALRVIVPKAET